MAPFLLLACSPFARAQSVLDLYKELCIRLFHTLAVEIDARFRFTERKD
jgi:hypothetical protein